VRSGEPFTYAFPLKFFTTGRVDDVRITLYLFKAPSGPAAGDIAKVFVKSPQRDDDGEYFYGVLPPLLKLQPDRARLLRNEQTVAYYLSDRSRTRYSDVGLSRHQAFHQASLVRITRGAFAIWLNPFGMLHSKVIVNLSSQVCVRMQLVKHAC